MRKEMKRESKGLTYEGNRENGNDEDKSEMKQWNGNEKVN